MMMKMVSDKCDEEEYDVGDDDDYDEDENSGGDLGETHETLWEEGEPDVVSA